MKDFTTAEHITPILTEIKSRFITHEDSITTNYLKCIIAIEDPTTRQFYPVSPKEELYIPNIAAYQETCKEIDIFTQAAETYAGELDQWNSREKERVFLAIRDNLIKEYK